MSQYITADELIEYGLPQTTTDIQIKAASAIIDGYLKRPEGLVWQPDYKGLPCYMAGLSPQNTFHASGAITAGSNVVIPLTEAVPAWNDMVGQTVILDRANASLIEACTITTFQNGSMTLSSVANNHSANCTVDFGLTIVEQRPLDSKRSMTRVARPPQRIMSASGRYDYGRRLDQESGYYEDMNLLAVMSTFGGPPLWSNIPTTQIGCSLTTHELWIPAGLLLTYYSTIRVYYVSGYQFSALPEEIKQATAAIVTYQSAYPDLNGNIKQIKVGQTTITRTINSAIGPDIVELLVPYRAKLFA